MIQFTGSCTINSCTNSQINVAKCAPPAYLQSPLWLARQWRVVPGKHLIQSTSAYQTPAGAPHLQTSLSHSLLVFPGTHKQSVLLKLLSSDIIYITKHYYFVTRKCVVCLFVCTLTFMPRIPKTKYAWWLWLWHTRMKMKNIIHHRQKVSAVYRKSRKNVLQCC